ncbi:MAG TPA: hypothetical protein ENJ10_02125 [Caldithrix abyssi]|uniref:TFIIB-type zinc ribbon-containing protein n=1 Tax=Caldithrix abyssi TaxID=187145 RepID=A0A7V1LK41_CALAY|nr:hypothetical protein [Caldithrix abyssi]
MAAIRFILPKNLNCPNCDVELDLDDTERKNGEYQCPNCGFKYILDDVSDKEKISILLQRVQTLEEQLATSRIFSSDFWSRAWAIFGHQLAVGSIIYLFLILLFLLLLK